MLRKSAGTLMQLMMDVEEAGDGCQWTMNVGEAGEDDGRQAGRRQIYFLNWQAGFSRFPTTI